jgi:hypothetical protein
MSLVLALTNLAPLMPVRPLAAIAIANAALSGVIVYPLRTNGDSSCASIHTAYMVSAHPKCRNTNSPDNMVLKPHWYVGFAVSGRQRVLSRRKE